MWPVAGPLFGQASCIDGFTSTRIGSPWRKNQLALSPGDHSRKRADFGLHSLRGFRHPTATGCSGGHFRANVRPPGCRDIMAAVTFIFMESKEASVQHIALESQDEAVKRFFLSLTVEAQGSVVEMNGQPIACLVPVAANGKDDDGEWADAKNHRRCQLIDKEIDGTLTPPEAAELQQLQRAMLRYRHKVAPLPLAAARQLHQELLERAGQSAR